MDIKELKEAQARYIKKMFSQPCYSKGQQSVKIINMLGEKPELLPQSESMSFLVSENMTAEQIVTKWYNFQPKNKKQQKGLEVKDYVLVHVEGKEMTPLRDNITLTEFKSGFQFETFLEGLTLLIYEHSYCPYHKCQSSMTESGLEEFEKKFKKTIDVPIKVIIDQKRAYYFYIDKESPEINIKQLHQLIQLQLKSKNHPIQCQKDLKYTLWVQKETIPQPLAQKIETKIPLEKLWKNNKLIIESQLFDFKVRQVCSPSQIITLHFTTPCFKYKSVPAAEDCLIRITCYKKNDKEQNQNQAQVSNLFSEKRVIEKNYSEIKKMKISTFLKQQGVQDPLVMSLYLGGEIIKPFVKFQEIQKVKKYIDNKKNIEFVCIPDNLLFYQQIKELANQKTMQDLLKQISENKYLPLKINETSKKEFKTQRTARLSRLSQTKGLQQEHKDPNFLDPIMVYTTDMICFKLNSFLRQTSIALFDQQKIRKDYWHYKTSKKIIQNLLKVQNYIGTVFRGSGQFQYNCKVGDTLQWSCFTSTSKQINTAKSFTQFLSNPYIFEIRTFTGKQIGKFSILQTQFEVLLLPYTKFKVLHVQQKHNCTYVKMLEIPVPKKIPGNIIVWIDNNFQQNAFYYSMFVKDFNLKNFDLIQLESNEHLTFWLNQFRYILDLPHVKLHFITNMNRTPKVAGKVPEGIETLNIIRNFSKTAKVVFFISNVWEKRADLKRAGKDKDGNVLLMEDPGQLMQYLLENSLKQ